MSDFLWYRPGSGHAGAYQSTAGGTRVQYVPYSSPGSPGQNGFGGDAMSTSDRAVPLDINGDGRSDFLWYRPGGGLGDVHILTGSQGALRYVPYRTHGGNANG